MACACAPAQVVGLLLSDVVGDDPSVIASGPLVPDPSTLVDALQVIEKYRLVASPAVLRHLLSPNNETPKLGDPCFNRVSVHIVASARMMLESAARFFEKRGLRTVILSDSVQGESVDAATVPRPWSRISSRQVYPVPCVLRAGRETTVTIRGKPRCRPYSEFLLALATAREAQDIDDMELPVERRH